jgi:hypothetical protein
MIMRAQGVRTHPFHQTHRGEDESATQFLIACRGPQAQARLYWSRAGGSQCNNSLKATARV